MSEDTLRQVRAALDDMGDHNEVEGGAGASAPAWRRRCGDAPEGPVATPAGLLAALGPQRALVQDGSK